MEEDVSKDLAEFALANAVYTALVEGHAAEISARRQAMENASNVGPFYMGSRIGAMMLITAERQRHDQLAAAAVQPWSTGCHHHRAD